MNRIIKVSRKQVELIKRKLSQNGKVFIAEVQGGRITNQKKYCEYMRGAFETPKEILYNYLDTYHECSLWMDNPWWLIEKGYKGFALIIKNYPLMLALHMKQKGFALECLNNCADSIMMKTEYNDSYPFKIYLETLFVSSKKFSLDEATDVYNDLFQ